MSDPAGSLDPKYTRVLLKLSGEALAPTTGSKIGINTDEASAIAEQLARVAKRGVQLAVVIGGGNWLRGAQFTAEGALIKPATADYMGMLATVMNGLALQDALENSGAETRLQSAVRLDSVAEPYIRRRAIRHLEKGRIVILAGGTGNPFVTTDTAAALRGRELHADILLKATKVDGVYNDDPVKNHYATKYPKLTFDEVIQKRLRVMDVSAFDQCREANLPILVFNYKQEGAIEKAIAGQPIGTIVSGKE